MFASYWTPLAPAAVLLLGAFILSVVVPRLPDRWRTRRLVREFGAPIVVGLAILAVWGIRLTVGADASGEGLDLLSGWNFSTVESVATLTVRADVLSLSFLILTLLVLLATTLAYSPQKETTDSVSGWLAMGAGACLLFVSANGLTIGYAVVAFDLLTMLYWLWRRQASLSVSRLFLGVFTASALVLATLNATAGTLLFGLALWLRLGFYPLVETINQTRRIDYGYLVYLALSLAVGVYLVTRVWVEPVAEVLLWLVVLTMLLSGLLVWLTDERPTWLVRLVTTEILLVLLTGSLAESVTTAYVLGLILSLVALWITPCWGKPQLAERAWAWPYLPAAAATLTTFGVPYALTWPARIEVYQSLFLSESLVLIILAVAAESLALSGLVRYWQMVWHGTDANGIQGVAGIVIMVPFLIPGLAPFVLSTLTKTELPGADVNQSVNVLLMVVTVVVAALALGYFRPQIMGRLRLSPESQTKVTRIFEAIWAWGTDAVKWVGTVMLRVEVLLQGQHYMGWALFTALVGVVIILLRTT